MKNKIKEEKRIEGEFFTPQIWVDEAHKFISKTIGEDWKEKFTVWDCACGKENLTKGYNFNDLFVSTLNQEDIDEIDRKNKFQFDFLNDDDISLMKKENLLFFINPPYVTANSANSYKTNGKRNSKQSTKINKLMLEYKMNKASSNLYTQFLYRIANIETSEYICIFCPEGFITKPSFKEFRKFFFSRFKFIDGFIFNANEFENITQNWAIGFFIFKRKKIGEVFDDISSKFNKKEINIYKYKQFNNDCYIYSLFSLQSSMRHIENYDGTYFDIENHFFYMSTEEIRQLAIENNYDIIIEDCKRTNGKNRFIYDKLETLDLSPDAKELLEDLRELTRQSFKYRHLAEDKYHLMTFDAGWYQIKHGILKIYMKEELKEFWKKFKQFENRLRPMVYEFGFLPHKNKESYSEINN